VKTSLNNLKGFNIMAMYNHIVVPLSGEDGNIFAILARTKNYMRRAEVPKETIDTVMEQVMQAGSYDRALQIIMKWVNVE
jgi:hypothetical protein